MKDKDERVEAAVSGDRQALESLLEDMQDKVFNLSLRMLGTVHDAQDATQEILLRMATHLHEFRGESRVETWVYRIAVNFLISYQKGIFAQRPLDFDLYEEDIRCAKLDETDELIDAMSREALAEELKLSCSNVMLQCLDPQSRCIFILGTMFGVDSRTAGNALGMTPENYRKRLSRARQKMAAFLSASCGLAGSPLCDCKRRVGYALKQGRISRERMEFVYLHPLEKETLFACREEMEKLDALACTFERFPCYRSPVQAEKIVKRLLADESMAKISEMGVQR